MQRVGLAAADKSTWERLHLIEFNFIRHRESEFFPDFGAVALVRKNQADPRLVEALQERLHGIAEVVDVADEAAATDQLHELLHIA